MPPASTLEQGPALVEQGRLHKLSCYRAYVSHQPHAARSARRKRRCYESCRDMCQSPSPSTEACCFRHAGRAAMHAAVGQYAALKGLTAAPAHSWNPIRSDRLQSRPASSRDAGVSGVFFCAPQPLATAAGFEQGFPLRSTHTRPPSTHSTPDPDSTHYSLTPLSRISWR